jgi:hypothetical protein
LAKLIDFGGEWKFVISVNLGHKIRFVEILDNKPTFWNIWRF